RLNELMARWLLMAHDSVDGDELPLSHEFLATMLGVRRAGITVAVGQLREAGLIDSSGGRFSILNRRGLEASACGCYRAVKEQYERLLFSPRLNRRRQEIGGESLSRARSGTLGFLR